MRKRAWGAGSRRRDWPRGPLRLTAALLAVALVGACQDYDGPTEPSLVSEAQSSRDALVSGTVAHHWGALVTQDRVEAEMAADPRFMDDPDVVLLLEWVSEARASGQDGEARLALMEAAVRVWGNGMASEAIRGVNETLNSVGSLVAQGGTAPEIQNQVARARRLAHDAASKLGGGEPAASLASSTQAAEALADLSPAKQAEAMVERARALYRQAVEVAGPSPEASVARALEEAGTFLNRAEAHLEAGRYLPAIRLARASMSLSIRLIQWASGGDTGPSAARVEAAIAEAESLLARAVALVGGSPRPPVAQILEQARSSLAGAKVAFAEGDLRAALRAALQSSAFSLRILNTAGSNAEAPSAERVEAAIAHAESLVSRAATLAGSNPQPPVSQWLAAARASLSRAHAAFAAADYRAALTAAQQATAYARRVIHALGG